LGLKYQDAFRSLLSRLEAPCNYPQVSGEIGCRCAIAHAYRDPMSWYERYGFISIGGAAAEGPRRLFLHIRTIRKALQSRP